MENWVLKNYKADFHSIMEQCKVSEVMARCLVNKGLLEFDEIHSYLHPDIDTLHDPFLLKDMKCACEILVQKIKSNKKIRIIGDYDVDGVVATYILYQSLLRLGADVDYAIPDRIIDGYGINMQMVDTAYEEQIDAILTCDNGIVAMDQVAQAKKRGMTVIITDHHSLSQSEEGNLIIPDADAVINPKQPDCSYPFQELCGAAIAFKLAVAMFHYFECKDDVEYIEELIAYTAIATVCDVMDLVGENRVLVKQGLSFLKKTKNAGLIALMDQCHIEKEQLTAFHLGFVIGPCLNASGRLDHASKGLALLLSTSKSEAIQLAGEVKCLNEKRKDMTLENVNKAIETIENSDMNLDKVLVIYLKDCHESIAGIIAGRIREKYHRPTIVLTDAKECIKGSGRSIEQYNMIEELLKCRDILLKVGGHPMAAGLSLRMEQVEILRKRLNESSRLTDTMLCQKVAIDIQLPFRYVTEELIGELKQLEPFGKGNERHLFAEKGLAIKSMLLLGKNASGIKFRLEDPYHRTLEALYFGNVNDFFMYIETTYGSEEVERLKTGRSSNVKLTITYFPKINEYKGYRNVQLMIQNYR